ncbi:MAG: hypothetical protein GY810_29790 [Aureispira sp.]|nr:hypothetical protein [Aureispira sp.]
MKTPFVWIGIDQHKKAFVVFTILTLLCMVGLGVSGDALKVNEAPMGILDYEFAGTLENAQAMLLAWKTEGVEAFVGFNLGLDYLFMLTYSHAIGLACVLVAQRLNRFVQLAFVLAALQLVAGGLDAIENFALWKLLLGSDWAVYPLISMCCAAPKFLFVILGLLFCLGSVFFKKKTV